MIIDFPSTLSLVTGIKWGQNRRDLNYDSPFSSQSAELSPPKWKALLTPAKFNRAEYAEWESVLLKLKGRQNQLALWHLDRPQPMGTMRGTMMMDGAHAQGDSVLNLSVLDAGSVPTTLLAGDLIGFGSGTTQHVVRVMEDAVAVQRVLKAADAAAADYFSTGVSLSADGLVLAVGANAWEGAFTDQGGVYLYDWSGGAWVQRGSVLAAADAAAFDRFGCAVSLSADGLVLAVGAYGWEGAFTDQGGVYLYDWSGGAWVQRGSVLAAADAAADDYFGFCVSLSADGLVLAVGAYGWEGAFSNPGGVYIYDWSGGAWVQRGSVLAAADAAAFDRFGCAVSLSADGLVLAVGALGWEGAFTDQGGVYLYDWSGGAWVQRGSVLAAADAAAGDSFGRSVSLSADGLVLAVGAYGWEGAFTDQGGVYLYDWSGGAWVQRGSVLAAADAAAGDYFGFCVSLSADGLVLAVGAYGWEGAFADQGGVYLYTRSGDIWNFQLSDITVTVEPPLRDAFPDATPVTWDKPKALFRRVSGNYEMSHARGGVDGTPLDLIESWQS